LQLDEPIVVGHSTDAATVMRVEAEYTVTRADDMAFT
jgi:hypothetical protein